MKFKSFLCLGLLSFLALTGCNKSTPKEHVHEYDKESIEWQWMELANGGYNAKAIFACDSCDEDAEGHFLTVDATVTNRQTKDPTCVEPGIITYTAIANYGGEDFSSTKEKPIYDENAHHLVEIQEEQYLKSAATCTEDAVYYKSCEYCHEKTDETFTVANSKLGHHMVHHDASTSTCQVHGNIEYYECDRCLKMFLDEAGANEVTEDDVLLPLSHHYLEVQDEQYLKSPATCTEDAVYYKSCEYCHEHGEETFTVANSKLGHHMIHHAATTSTCQVHGNIEYYECDRCNKLFDDENATNELSEDDVVLPYSHDMTFHAGTNATCTEDGMHDYYTCSYEPGVKYKDEAGNEKFNDDSELIIHKLGHEFNESLDCVRGDTTLKEEYGMEDAAPIDVISPVTVSDLKYTSGGYVKTGSEGHTFLDYNFLSNGGADIWMKYRYSHADGNYDEAALQLYLLNNHSEDGLRIRLDGRAENDGIAVLYVYSSGQYNNPGTDDDIPSAPAASAMYFFPRPAQFKADTDIIMHFAITLTDPVKNIFNVKIEAGSNGTLYQVSKGAEAGDYSPRSFNIEMGEGFSSWVNKSVRMTAKRSSDITISDIESQENAVVYKDAVGNAVGKLNNPGTAKVPQLVSVDKTFIGWFDPNGNRINDGDNVSGKVIITPRFVETQTNMFIPSDTNSNTFAAAKGGWFESSSFTNEAGDYLPVDNVTNRYDVYFIYRFVAKSAADNYAIFGLPYDFTDAKTRINIRIDNRDSGDLIGYIYDNSTNLGPAGAQGTMFQQSGFGANGRDLLIHMAVYNASSAGLTLEVEITNLGNGQVFNTTRDVTFNVGDLYAINNPTRNMLDFIKVNCEYRITDAF